MKTEQQLKKRAGIIFLLSLIVAAISALVYSLTVYEAMKVVFSNGGTFEDVLNLALGGFIALAVLRIVGFFLDLAWWLTFIKLWKWYGPRFWRCTWVILGVLGFIYYVTGTVLLVAFNINVLYLGI